MEGSSCPCPSIQEGRADAAQTGHHRAQGELTADDDDRRSPHLRTTFEAEHILTHNDLKFISRFLDIQDVRYFHLFSVLTAPLLGTRLFDGALRLANLLDGVILKVKPFRYLAWQVYFELVRPKVS